MPIGAPSAPIERRSWTGDRGLAFLLLAALVAAFPWDDTLGYPTETLSIVKLLGLALGVAFVASAPWRSPPVLAPILVPMAVFLALVAASWLTSGDVGGGSGPTARYVQYAALVVLVIQVVRTSEGIVTLFGVLTASAAAAAVVGLSRFLVGTADRASGPIGDANDFAYVLATAVPLGLHLVAREGRARWAWGAAVVAIVAGTAGTLSRGALIGLAVAAVWAVLARRVGLRSVAAAAAVLVVGAGFALVLERPFIEERLGAKGVIAGDNVDSRAALWRGAVDMAEDHPLLGVGTGLYPARAADYVVDDPLHLVRPVAHNAYLEVLAENGVPALVAFLAFVAGTGLLLHRSHHEARRHGRSDLEAIATALQSSHIVAVVGALFLSVQIAPPLWFVGALAVVLRALVRRSAPDAASP
ncbi:MAG TPA: O-antigen ligase family protein [Acidimicrobiales bacterium]|nr:O-antigen ligase family protein [Acidimicrobiales bacterium]